MASSRRIHWAVPTTMLIAFLSGLLLALGHHLFYASLNRRAAPIGAYNVIGTNVPKQQFNTAVGTTFAFLVKASFALAVGTAYTQMFWRTARTVKPGNTLSTLDTTYSILANFLGVFKVAVWWRHPLLLLLALTSWTIPIASIVTPATLSVESALVDPPVSFMSNVPRFDFVNLNFAAPITASSGTNYSQYCYNAPSSDLQRLATAVAASGEVLPIAYQGGNATWSFDFFGPSLECAPPDETKTYDIWNNVFQYLNNQTRCSWSYGYLSWQENNPDSYLPFFGQGENMTFNALNADDGVPFVRYYATLPKMFENLGVGASLTTGGCLLEAYYQMDSNVSAVLNSTLPPIEFFADSTLLQCNLVNASYTATFNFSGATQMISVEKHNTTTSDPVTYLSCVTGPDDPPEQTKNNSIVMADFNNTSCSTLNYQGANCLFDPQVVQTLSYQSIALAFADLTSGDVNLGGPNVTTPAVTFDSAIGTTVLMDTPEMAFIKEWHLNSSVSDAVDYNSALRPNLQTVVQMSIGDSFKGISGSPTSGTRGSLASTLEELFMNITLSTLSEPFFLPNHSSPYAPPALTNVTLHTYHNVYVYAARTLLIAYGIATLFVVIAVAIGLAAIFLNNAAYENNFSTILRVSRVAHLSEEMREEDGGGAAPLPKHLRKAHMIWTHDGMTDEGSLVKTPLMRQGSGR